MLLLLLACTCARPVEEPPAGGPAAGPPAARPQIVKPPDDFVPDNPAQLAEECGARIEGEEKDGECQIDADCVPAGCSREVCVPASVAEQTYTTCETRLCFMAVDTCGCAEGRCRWSIKPDPAGSR